MCLKTVIFLSTLIVQILAEKCTTPNNEEAECMSLYSCPVLLGALATQHKISVEFVRRSSCGRTAADQMVCCGTASNFTVSEQNVKKMSLLPTKVFCGYQHSDDYVRPTDKIGISEFPWLARLKYIIRGRNGTELTQIFWCSGTLINTRYVLTAAQCVTSNNITPTSVYLGEYHVYNETDCVQEKSFTRECSDPVKEVGVEKIIPHANFNAREQTDDIALLRLNKSISFTDYIRPICLPFMGTTIVQAGDVLTSSGWGDRSYRGESAEIKKKVFSTLISNEECSTLYNTPMITINDKHLCTSPLENNTDLICDGDGGAPVMFSHKKQWHQEGIVSFGKPCGVGVPSVSTRVVRYIDWILENIEA